MDPARQAGTFLTTCPGSRATVTKTGMGAYRVLFPCIGSAGGIAHVTAIDAAGRSCMLGEWYISGRDEAVQVFCFDGSGGQAAASCPGRGRTAAAITPSECPVTTPRATSSTASSCCRTTIKAPCSAGRARRTWEVVFPDVGAPLTHMQVSAFGGGPIYCQPANGWTDNGWTDNAAMHVVVKVSCF